MEAQTDISSDYLNNWNKYLQTKPQGLNNLGNTCFMSAALQLIFNCRGLNYFFLYYYQQTMKNKENPIGYKGELVDEFYCLLKHMLLDQGLYLDPRLFHSQIKKFGEQFHGYHQNDSHEILCHILDGILEDIKSPEKYSAQMLNIEEDGDEDDKLSKIKVKGMYEQKGSIITQLFYGQFMSTIYCTKSGCSPTKVFESFLTLSISIYVHYFKCTFVYYDIKKQPITVQIAIEKDKTINDKKLMISKIFHITIDAFIISEKLIKDKGYQVICFQINPDSHPIDDTKKILENIDKYEKQKTEIFELKPNEKELNETYFQVLLNIEEKNQKKDVRMMFIQEIKELTYDNIYNFIKPLVSNDKDTIQIQYNIASKDNSNEQPFIDYCLGCFAQSCKGCLIEKNKDNEQESQINNEQESQINNQQESQINNQQESQINNQQKTQINSIITQKSKIIQIDITSDSINLIDNLILLPQRKTLQQCIKNFSNCAELLGNWRCSKCFTIQKAKKKIQIYTVPPYLIIHLKRNQDETELITYPIERLDMSPYLAKQHEPIVYDLKGVINYHNSFFGGHYTNTIRHFVSNQWYKIDDYSCASISEKDIITPNAVVLLYEKQGINIKEELDKYYLNDYHELNKLLNQMNEQKNNYC